MMEKVRATLSFRIRHLLFTNEASMLKVVHLSNISQPQDCITRKFFRLYAQLNVYQQRKTSAHAASLLDRAINFCARLDEYAKELLKNVTSADTNRLVGRRDAPSKSLQHSMVAVWGVGCPIKAAAALDVRSVRGSLREAGGSRLGQDMQFLLIAFAIH